MDHGRSGTLSITSTQTVNNALLVLAIEWVPLPLRGVGNTDSIEIAIIEQYPGTIPNASKDVAHSVPTYLIKAKINHMCADNIANWTNLAIKARNSDEVAQELYHGGVVLCQFSPESD